MKERKVFDSCKLVFIIAASLANANQTWGTGEMGKASSTPADYRMGVTQVFLGELKMNRRVQSTYFKW